MILEMLNKELKKALKTLGFDDSGAAVGYSDRPDLCDYQTNCAFAIAKKAGKPPLEIAQNIIQAFCGEDGKLYGFSAEAVRPGFINFSVSPELIKKEMLEVCRSENCGITKTQKPKTIIIDYGGPNIAKPLHVGHLRSAVIGESLKRLARGLGHKVTADIHMGDWGKQMGLVILGLTEKFDLSGYFKAGRKPIPPFTVKDFEEIYPTASSRSKTDEEFNAKAQKITQKLQSHEMGYYEIWRDIVKLSVKEIKKDYKSLNVTFDLWKGESTCEKYIEPMLKDFKKQKLVCESEGALIMNVAEPTDTSPMPPVLLQTAAGANMYACTDLATITERMKLYNPDEIWYVADARQKLHFEQVFRAARKAGIVREQVKLVHIPFGTVNGTDGKPFKTRDGKVMKLGGLVSEVAGLALKKGTVSKINKADALKIGVSALKFGDLINNRNKDYIFDLDKFSQFDGKTGPYMLYTVARINSLLNKIEFEPKSGMKLNFEVPEFKAIAISIFKIINAYQAGFNEKLPNILCEACYDTANAYNEIYGKYRILTEKNSVLKNTLLTITFAVKKVLEQTLNVLGIDTVGRM